jgi:hypothetical protein
MSDFKADVHRATRQRILFTRHALDQMNKPDRLISESEVREVLEQGDVIEEYPDDPRGPSGLMGQQTSLGRFVHVVCSPKSDYLAIITAYVPDPSEWDEEFRTRRR